jgi:hypothetical protein
MAKIAQQKGRQTDHEMAKETKKMAKHTRKLQKEQGNDKKRRGNYHSYKERLTTPRNVTTDQADKTEQGIKDTNTRELQKRPKMTQKDQFRKKQTRK